MQRFKLLGISLAAIFLLATITATAAFAEAPEVLKPATGSTLFRSTSGEGKFVAEAAPEDAIICKKDKDNGLLEHSGLGTITIDFEECKLEGTSIECHSLGDPKGIILVGFSSLDLVALKQESKLVLGVLLTLKELHIECEKLILFLIKGSIIGWSKEAKTGVATSTVTFLFKQTGGVQELKTCEFPKALCEGKTYELLTSIGGGTNFKKSAELEETDVITFLSPVEVDF